MVTETTAFNTWHIAEVQNLSEIHAHREAHSIASARTFTSGQQVWIWKGTEMDERGDRWIGRRVAEGAA